MAKSLILHNAVFFIGDRLQLTTRRLACMTFDLCRKHTKKGDIVFVDGLESVETTVEMHHDHSRIFFINATPCDPTLLMKLRIFYGNKAIVYVDFDDGSQEPQHQASSLLKLVRDIPVIQLTDRIGGESHRERVSWLLSNLQKVVQPPILPTIIEKALANKDTPARVTDHPAHTLAIA